jgi:hypothetical protein
VASRKYTSLQEAVREERVSRHYLFFFISHCFKYFEIHAKNSHVSFTESSQQRQTLAPEEQQVLLDYAESAGKSSVDSTRTSCMRT